MGQDKKRISTREIDDFHLIDRICFFVIDKDLQFSYQYELLDIITRKFPNGYIVINAFVQENKIFYQAISRDLPIIRSGEVMPAFFIDFVFSEEKEYLIPKGFNGPIIDRKKIVKAAIRETYKYDLTAKGIL